MNIFAWIQSFFRKKYPTGLILDPRFESEKALDYLHEEIAGAATPVYKIDDKASLNQFPEENQNQTFSCVAHGSTLAMTQGNPRLSKMMFYRSRQNYPNEGMWLQDAGRIAKNIGACLYQTLPNVYSETEANNINISDAQKVDASQNKVGNYIQIQNFNDIDTLASIVTPTRPVVIIIYASYREWSQEYPDAFDNTTLATAPIRHCVAVVDAYMENGMKYLKIQDSAHFGGLSVRYLSEDFVLKRVYGAMYFMKLTPGPSPKPDYIFNANLRQGDSNEEVTMLQKRLMYEGLFPVAQSATGYFGGITLKAVKDYQAKHGIPTTGFVGVITRAQLNT